MQNVIVQNLPPPRSIAPMKDIARSIKPVQNDVRPRSIAPMQNVVTMQDVATQIVPMQSVTTQTPCIEQAMKEDDYAKIVPKSQRGQSLEQVKLTELI